jgi:vancomycin resistance protein VanJ
MENNRAAAILGLLRREKADVVLLQELEPAMYRFLDAGLQDVYAYRHLQRHRRRGGSLGFFSCMPFEITGLWRSRPMAPYAVRATLELPQGPVDLYNVHLLSVGVRAMLGTGLNGNFRLREAQAATLAQEIEARELPALALGDFNMTEGNEAYAVAHRRLADAWLLAGRGPGWTWPRRLGLVHKGRHSLRPVLRLDYCFCSPGVDPRDARVLLDDTGSDHCPILVEAVVS